ncbi:MAG: winged helix-turn-helix domain-containing protein [Alphaproteobacteria bacterium]|nr:winged helix-turn-helix domain-containing protein [Alphaproteobacteria bacterium]
MKEGPDIVRIAALIGDPARANMLLALMGGTALTATELAHEAGITKQTASAHLGKLESGGLLRQRKQGRHRYFALADDDVAAVLEALLGFAATQGQLRTRPGPRDAAMRKARVCYHHLAGEMGIRLYTSLVSSGYLALTADGIEPTEEGRRFLVAFGVDMAELGRKKAPLCRECLDWSERRSHLGGSVGRALLQRFQDLGWARQVAQSRAVLFSPSGEAAFRKTFPVD